MAPTPALAHGTTLPTPKNLLCTATPRSQVPGSNPTTEKVATRGAAYAEALLAPVGVRGADRQPARVVPSRPVRSGRRNRILVSAPSGFAPKSRAATRPLTPALSPSDGERETRPALTDESSDSATLKTVRQFFLSPSDGERAGVRGFLDDIIALAVSKDLVPHFRILQHHFPQ